MAINKSAKQKESDSVINTLLYSKPGNQKHKKEKKLKNLRIDADLCRDYEVLCEYIKRSSFTDEVIRFMEIEVQNNAEAIDQMKIALDL